VYFATPTPPSERGSGQLAVHATRGEDERIELLVQGATYWIDCEN
jgi:hypothetical protein